MNWDKDKSITLSLWVTRIFMLILIILAISAYWLVNWYVDISWKPERLVNILLFSTYSCCVPAAVALYCLNKLLTNVRKEIIFHVKNIKMLRMLSWCCVAVGFITFFSGIYYLPLMIISVGAFFMALIIRVVKNCFQVAQEIKQENEMTI